MGKAASVLLLGLALCALLAAAPATVEAAAACNPQALAPCAGAVMFGGAVTPGCCAQLRAQQGCLCGYARNPAYGGYVNGAAAQRLARSCGLPRLNC